MKSAAVILLLGVFVCGVVCDPIANDGKQQTAETEYYPGPVSWLYAQGSSGSSSLTEKPNLQSMYLCVGQAVQSTSQGPAEVQLSAQSTTAVGLIARQACMSWQLPRVGEPSYY